jgi:hypothetical protein
MTAALQRTVRRVGALLLLQLGAISAQLYGIAPGGAGSIATFVTIPLFVGALLYLLGSVVRGVGRVRDPPESVRD